VSAAGQDVLAAQWLLSGSVDVQDGGFVGVDGRV
jgi:hypothetical protein